MQKEITKLEKKIVKLRKYFYNILGDEDRINKLETLIGFEIELELLLEAECNK